MDEQKRLLLAVVLSIIVLVGYQFYFTPEPQLDNPSQEVPTQTQEQPAKAPPMFLIILQHQRSFSLQLRISAPYLYPPRCITLPFPNIWQR
jgi:hypothetical protein